MASVWEGYRAAMRMSFRFSGRSPCEAVWMFLAAWIVISALAFLLDQGVGLVWHKFIGFRFAARLIHVLPYMALLVRRMHDIDRRGWAMAWPPTLFKALFEGGTPGPNRFGSPPGEMQAEGGSTIR